jgi:superfamily II DNA or RNA helicase
LDIITPKDELLIQGIKAFRKADYNGIALLPTGSGKGKLMIELAKEINPESILYLCNTRLLRDKTFIDELHKWDAAHLLNRMELKCYQAACKMQGQHYSLLLGDEFDAAITPEYIKAITNNVFDKKILVSATLSDDKKRKAKKIAPIIFERSLQETIETNVLNNIKFFLVHYDLSEEENREYLHYNARFSQLLNEYRTPHVERQLRWLQIQRKQFLSKLKSSVEVTRWLLNNLDKKNEKVLIFCGLSEQADKVCENSYHSKRDEIEIFNNFAEGKIKHMAVVDKVDRGQNIPGVRNIILESVGSNITKLTQRIGRGMRLLPDEYLNAYFLVPHFRTNMGHKRATIVQDWIINSTKDMDLSHAKIINYVKS